MAQDFFIEIDMNNLNIKNIKDPQDDQDAINKRYLIELIASLLNNLDFQRDVLNTQTDAIFNPGEATIGDRYIITDASNLNENFGTITGLEDNDIVEFIDDKFEILYDVSVENSGAIVWDRGNAKFKVWTGVIWDDLIIASAIQTLSNKTFLTPVIASFINANHNHSNDVNGSTIDHGNVTGLSDDDHTQYSRADGSRAFTNAVAGVSPTNPAHLTTKSYVDSIAANLDWQKTVISIFDNTSALPSNPTAGDRYIAKVTANGWTIHHIYECVTNGTWVACLNYTPTEGYTSWIKAEDVYYRFNGTSWEIFEGLALVTAGAGLTKNGNQMDIGGTEGRIVVNTNSIDLATVGIAGTYTKVTVDAYGRIYLGATLSSSDLPSHTHAKSDSGLENVDNVQQMPLSYLDTDTALTGNSDVKVPSQKAVKTYADGKVTKNNNITAATKTKITYDAKGLVTGGADLSAADITAPTYAADGGSTDSYAITLSPVPASYTVGMIIIFKANTKNTGAATVNVNTLGAKSLKKFVNVDLENGDILAGQMVQAIYDGTNFQMQSIPGMFRMLLYKPPS